MTELEIIISQFILESGKLQTLPELYNQLESAMRSRTAKSDDVADLLATDASLSAKILKLANSPAFGFRSEISTIHRAVNLIGFKEVRNFVLVNSVVGQFKKGDFNHIDIEEFWQRNVYTAIIAKKLGKLLKHPEPDRLFSNGILSRIGLLVICHTDKAKAIDLNQHLSSGSIIDEYTLEQEILGFTLSELSGALLEHWKVPESLYLPLKYASKALDETIYSDKTVNAVRMDIEILYMAICISFLLTQQNKNITGNHPTVSSSIDSGLKQKLVIEDNEIEDLLFDIEMDSMEILSAVFPEVLSVY